MSAPRAPVLAMVPMSALHSAITVPVSPLRRSRHVWFWPKNGWSGLDLPALANAIQSYGFEGVIVQDGQVTLATMDAHRFVPTMTAAGLEVCVGFGTSGPSHWQDLANVTNAALARDDVTGVMLDWEGSWDGHQAEATSCVAAILAQTPNAPDRTVDCPWWAPLTTPDGHPTHPSAPTKQFGTICKRRFVQAYGAPTPGASVTMWRWAQNPSQYPSLGTPATNVMPAWQMYQRTLQDQVDSLLLADAGPVACWNWLEADANARQAWLVVKALARLALTGPSAVKMFQAQVAGLKVDGLVGPATLAALGVPA